MVSGRSRNCNQHTPARQCLPSNRPPWQLGRKAVLHLDHALEMSHHGRHRQLLYGWSRLACTSAPPAAQSVRTTPRVAAAWLGFGDVRRGCRRLERSMPTSGMPVASTRPDAVRTFRIDLRPTLHKRLQLSRHAKGERSQRERCRTNHGTVVGWRVVAAMRTQRRSMLPLDKGIDTRVPALSSVDCTRTGGHWY